MADPIPYFMVRPYIALGPTATAVELQCAANAVEITPEQDETTAETFCGQYTNYKPPRWTITITMLHSFDSVDGIWSKLQPLFGTLQPFVIKPEDAAASADNPVMSGTARVKYAPFLSGNVGEASDFDLELAVQGVPVFGETEPVITAEAETEPQTLPAEAETVSA